MNKFRKLIKLSPDNFTPLSRTPWAGSRLAHGLKSQLHGYKTPEKIGESWEFSCEPDFPSFVPEWNLSLPELFKKFPQELLSRQFIEKTGLSECNILVKYIDAEMPLSLQIHPEDNDPFLQPNECGKPEAWYILDHEPGAGIYLGFKQKLNQQQLTNILSDHDKAKEVLQFVPVAVGDYFEISPKIPHAIGKGVTLLEPQQVLFGKKGKTYRMWDWGRKYDTHGNVDHAHGKARELHIEESVRLLNFDDEVGENYVATLRRNGTNVSLDTGITLKSFPANDYCQLIICDIAANKSFELSCDMGYAICLQLKGKNTFESDAHEQLQKGETGIIPFVAFPVKVSAYEESQVAFIFPAHSQVNMKVVNHG